MFDNIIENSSLTNPRRFEFINKIASDESDKYFKKLPERSTCLSAGYDFYNIEDITLNPAEITYVKTGIKAAMGYNDVFILCNRSSNPKKKGLILINGIGVIDSDYYNNIDNEGEIAFAFYNISKEPVTIKAGDKLGQGIFMQYNYVNGDTISKGNKRQGGLGSTGN